MGSRGSKPSICAFWQMRAERFRAPLRSRMKARFCGFWTPFSSLPLPAARRPLLLPRRLRRLPTQCGRAWGAYGVGFGGGGFLECVGGFALEQIAAAAVVYFERVVKLRDAESGAAAVEFLAEHIRLHDCVDGGQGNRANGQFGAFGGSTNHPPHTSMTRTTCHLHLKSPNPNE